MTPSKAFQCPLSFQILLKPGPYKHASFGTSCKLAGREWVWQLAAVYPQEACTLQFWGYRQIMFITSLVGKRAICSLCGGGVFPSSAAFYCLSLVVSFIAKHFRCYCWRTNIRHYVYTQAYLCITMCKTLKHPLNSPVSQQALIQLEQPGDCFPFLRSMSWHSSTSQCWNANLQDSMSRPTWNVGRTKLAYTKNINDWCFGK